MNLNNVITKKKLLTSFLVVVLLTGLASGFAALTVANSRDKLEQKRISQEKNLICSKPAERKLYDAFSKDWAPYMEKIRDVF